VSLLDYLPNADDRAIEVRLVDDKEQELRVQVFHELSKEEMLSLNGVCHLLIKHLKWGIRVLIISDNLHSVVVSHQNAPLIEFEVLPKSDEAPLRKPEVLNWHLKAGLENYIPFS